MYLCRPVSIDLSMNREKKFFNIYISNRYLHCHHNIHLMIDLCFNRFIFKYAYNALQKAKLTIGLMAVHAVHFGALKLSLIALSASDELEISSCLTCKINY